MCEMFVLNGDGLFSRLRARRDDIVVTMRDAMITQVPGYGGISAAKGSELLDDVHHVLTRALDLSPDDAPNTEADLEYFAAVGQRRADYSLSLTDLQAGFQVSYLAAVRYCLSQAEHGDHTALMQLTAWGAREVPRTIQAATTAWAAAHQNIGDGRLAREFLARQLVGGAASDAAAAAAGVELPQGYLVLACQVQRPLELRGTERRMAVENRLKAVPGALWLGGLNQDRLLILLPTDDEVTSAQLVAAELIADVGGVVDQVVYAAQAIANLSEVPGAVREAEQVLVLIAAMPDVESRPYRTEELLVELAIMRQPGLPQRLGGLLAPLKNGTDLLRTLQVLFGCGLDRERSAKALCIHRRTLTYRLARIRALTGIDPTSPHGIQLLRAALTVIGLPAPEGSEIQPDHKWYP